MMLRRVAVLLALTWSALLAPGCRGCDGAGTGAGPSGSASVAATPAVPDLTPAERTGAEDAVVAYYAAISVKDCAGMNKLAMKPHTPEECQKIIEDYVEHGTRFVRVDEVKRDGRDPNAVIVKIILLFKDKDHPTLVRTTKVGDAWRVRN